MGSSTAEAAALALFQAGRLAEAEGAWRAILERRPGDAEAQHLLGLILARTGRRDEGLGLLERSIEAAPRNAAFLNNRALLLGESGRLADAERDLRRALTIEPRFYAGLTHLGSVLRQQGRLEEAQAAFRRALAVDARSPHAHAGLGNVLLERGDADGARVALERSLALGPSDAEVLNNLGLALQHLGRLEEAVTRYAAAVEARPGFAGALTNWGNALKDQGDLEGAGALYDRALEADPRAADAMNNRANVALELGDFEGAKRLYRSASALRPEFPDPRFSLAQIALFERDFASGWEGYELRFDTTHPMATRRPLALPALGREDLGRGLGTAVLREQGIGDLILFSTLLPELRRSGVRPVVELDHRLVRLYSRCLPEIAFVDPESSARAFADCEAQIALGSLPRLFRRAVADFERQPRALLSAEPERVRAMRSRLGPGRWIAVSWRSVQKPDRRYVERRKSMPIELLERLAEVPGVRLLDVQYGDVNAEREAFAMRHPGRLTRLEDLDTFSDFEGLIAALAACEAVVTVSNVTAHLAGAIGKRTLLVYPAAHAPFHYWVPGADGKSPWYPSVEIVTERAWTDWAPGVDAAARRLATEV